MSRNGALQRRIQNDKEGLWRRYYVTTTNLSLSFQEGRGDNEDNETSAGLAKSPKSVHNTQKLTTTSENLLD